MHLLVVDDDPTVRESLADALRELGHDVRQACGGREALESMRTPPLPDAVLADLLMPRMNGQQLMDEMRATPELARIPVVVISATVPALFSGRGADAALGKPVSLPELRRVLERLERKAPGSAASQ